MIKSTLIGAVELGAKELTRYFNSSFSISSKATINDLVTEADLASEKVIIEHIQANFPDHFILSEEKGEIMSMSDTKWIIDPIDGTINFANGIPICCVSIGVEHKGEMVFGSVFNPLMNEFFFAEKGKGATLNGKPIHVSKKSDLLQSILVTGFPYQCLDNPNGPFQVFERLVRKGIPVRRFGSSAIDLCWTADGRFDGFYEHQIKVWDSAAGLLMVVEAGGKVSDLSGNSYNPYQPGIIATNSLIHDQLLSIINGKKY